jgi:transcriptional regulator with XRE-family HTH domain
MSRLRALRVAQGLKISDLCYALKIHPTTVSATERQKLAPSSRVRSALCSYLGVAESEMFGDTGLAL